MKLIKNLFRKKDPPEPNITIPNVGAFTWDEETEYWIGCHNGFKLSLSYDDLSHPKEELTQFLQETVANSEFPRDAIRKIKELAKAQYPEELYSEIEALEPKDIVFQAAEFVLIQFFGPEDNEPFWSSEIHGTEVYVSRDT